MSDLRVVRTLPETAWRRFVDENPDGSIFHTPEMFQVFTNSQGFDPQLWAVVDASNQPLALLLPVKISLRGGLMRRFTTRAVVFGSVIWKPGAEGLAALDVLLGAYAKDKKDAPMYTELRNLSDLGEALPVLEAHKFVYEAHLNYIIDLRDGPETVLKNIGSRTRKNIRHGLNKGDVQVEEITERSQISRSYDLLTKTYQHAQVPIADRSLFEAAFDVLQPRGMIRFAQARVGNVDVATSVELIYKNVVYGWYGGVDRDYGSYSPNELIMWNVLEWSSRNGYHFYDFGGAGKPEEEYGVRDFKAKFGGKLVSYGRNVFIHHPRTLWLSKQVYALVRRWL